MKRCLCTTAFGLAVLWLAGQEAAAQSAQPAAPTKVLPPVGVTSDPAVVRSSQEASEAHDAPATPLEELAWMVGDWVDRDEDSTIETSVAWTKNGKFLRRMFRVTPRDGAPHAGMQIIGWDPAEQTIRSWTYDEEGGFGEERWRRAGDRWTIRTKYTLPDGARASATNVLRRIDDDTCTWRSVNRTIGGALQPDIDEVTVIRKNGAEDPDATRGQPQPIENVLPRAPAPEQTPAAETPTASNPTQEKRP
jgi:hypothetical protein